MATLLQHQSVLDLDDVDVVGGAIFELRSTASAPRVVLDFTRWIEMGRPRQITVTIHPGVRTDVDHGALVPRPVSDPRVFLLDPDNQRV